MWFWCLVCPVRHELHTPNILASKVSEIRAGGTSGREVPDVPYHVRNTCTQPKRLDANVSGVDQCGPSMLGCFGVPGVQHGCHIKFGRVLLGQSVRACSWGPLTMPSTPLAISS